MVQNAIFSQRKNKFRKIVPQASRLSFSKST